jgi:Na+/H+ antiporter NhaD/arsenite permease-like protein
MTEPAQAAHAVTEVSTSIYWLATAIFVVAYAVIVSEKVHKTKVALMGAALMMALPILTQHEAFHSEEFGIDYNVIFLLISMMIIINIMAKSGIFEWVAIRAAKMAKGRPFTIMAIFAVFTAVASAFLDNVTTVLLLAPVTLLIADELDVDPVPYLIAEALASNIGGTATLIGDPPNIMIASKAHYSFMDFIYNLSPAIIITMIAFVVVLKVLFGKRLQVNEEKRRRVMAMDESSLIKDPVLMKKSLFVMGCTIVGFTMHGALHLEPATIALTGAAVLLLISGEHPHHILAEVEWTTIFFFMGLFIIVGGVVKVGLIKDLSQVVIDITRPTEQSMSTTSFVILWFSAFASAIVDNIPFVATMNPLVLDMANTVFHGGAHNPAALAAATLHHDVLEPVWWSLALGACLGGNGSPIGASANVIVVGMAEKAGKPISFGKFMAYGLPVMIMTLVIAHAYIYVRYYVLHWY